MLDWIAGSLELLGCWIVGNKNKYAFLCWMGCGVLWSIVAIHSHLYGLLIVVVPGFFMNLRNFIKWSKRKPFNTKSLSNYEILSNPKFKFKV